MYCPVCEEEVQCKREDINWAILVLLTIFTAGFGNLIYIAVWLKKPMNRCQICDSFCYRSKRVAMNSPVYTQRNSEQVTTTVSEKTPKDDKNHKYCASCGAKLDMKAQFCAYCGYSLV